MAGTGWKIAGTILIVLGAFGVLLGLASVVLGGVVANGAISDANDCESSIFSRCDEDSLGERAEAGFIGMLAGGGMAALGLLFLIVGIVFVFVGGSRARKEAQQPPRTVG